MSPDNAGRRESSATDSLWVLVYFLFLVVTVVVGVFEAVIGLAACWLVELTDALCSNEADDTPA
jgi:hypothetical protein